MKNLLNIASDFIRDEEGLTMVEYALAGALIAAAVAAGFRTLGTQVDATAGIIEGEMANQAGG